MRRETRYSPDLAGLGRFVRERRQTLGLTQQQLGDRLGWVQERISLLEGGKYGTPSIAALAGLAEALEVPQAELLRSAGYLDPTEPVQMTEPVVQRVAGASPARTDPAERQEWIAGLNRESSRLFHQVSALQNNLYQVQEQIEVADQLRQRMKTTRRQIEILTASLQPADRRLPHR
jgi:transcriptional regulator with XRE-family HTH domain